MKAFKVEILVLDHDGLGEQGVRQTIEHTRYPNHCISPQVMAVESREIEWADDHPLNRSDLAPAEYTRLFAKEGAA
jgi:hypothetical protein